MSKLNVSYRLKPYSSRGLLLETALNSLTEQLVIERDRQREALKLNQTVDCTVKTSYSNATARALALPVNLWPLNRQYPWDEMTRSEVYRLLSTWQQRSAIARELEKQDYELAYEDRSEAFKYAKRQQWENIQRSKQVPKLPAVNSVRLPLSKSSAQYAWVYQEGRNLELYLTTLSGDCVLEFQIPEKVTAQYPNSKATRPDIILDQAGELSFVYSLELEAPNLQKSETIVGVDLGISRAYASSIIDPQAATISPQRESLEVYRDRRALAKLDTLIANLARKNKRRESLGEAKPAALREAHRLREKRARLIDSLDWQIASDVVELAPPGAVIALEDLRWSGGGSVKFRHSLQQAKIEHVAKKKARRVKKVNAAYSSQECPSCGGKIQPGKNRVSRCECGFEADRDTAASLVIAKRAGAKLSTMGKGRATPKRPVARKILVSLTRKTGSTGSSLSNPPARQESGARLEAVYRSPIGTVGAGWRKRPTLW